MQRISPVRSGWQLLKSCCEGAAKQVNTSTPTSRNYSRVSRMLYSDLSGEGEGVTLVFYQLSVTFNCHFNVEEGEDV